MPIERATYASLYTGQGSVTFKLCHRGVSVSQVQKHRVHVFMYKPMNHLQALMCLGTDGIAYENYSPRMDNAFLFQIPLDTQFIYLLIFFICPHHV